MRILKTAVVSSAIVLSSALTEKEWNKVTKSFTVPPDTVLITHNGTQRECKYKGLKIDKGVVVVSEMDELTDEYVHYSNVLYPVNNKDLKNDPRVKDAFTTDDGDIQLTAEHSTVYCKGHNKLPDGLYRIGKDEVENLDISAIEYEVWLMKTGELTGGAIIKEDDVSTKIWFTDADVTPAPKQKAKATQYMPQNRRRKSPNTVKSAQVRRNYPANTQGSVIHPGSITAQGKDKFVKRLKGEQTLASQHEARRRAGHTEELKPPRHGHRRLANRLEREEARVSA